MEGGFDPECSFFYCTAAVFSMKNRYLSKLARLLIIRAGSLIIKNARPGKARRMIEKLRIEDKWQVILYGSQLFKGTLNLVNWKNA
jgi:hypothetical protein